MNDSEGGTWVSSTELQALRQSEQLYRTSFEQSPACMGRTGIDGVLLDVNPTFCRWLGYEREELVGKRTHDITHPDDLGITSTQLDKMGRPGSRFLMEKRYLRRDGNAVWACLQGATICDAQGAPSYVEFVIQDITERKRAEESLQESEERYRSLAESGEDPIYLLNRDLVFEYVNTAGARALGRRAEDVVGKPITDTFPPEQAAAQTLSLKAVLESASTFQSERKYSFAGGDRWMSTWLVPVRGADGAVEAVLGTSHDVTERKQAEQALRQREEQLSLIQETVCDVIFYLVVEPGGNYRFVSVNRAFLMATGLAEEQVCGKLVQDVIPEPVHDLVIGKYAEAIRERRTVRWEEVSEYPSGKKYGDVVVTPIFDEQGDCTHLVGTVHDTTSAKRADEERRSLEAKIQHAQKLESLGILAGGIAHDFNNMLVGILGRADLALDRLPSHSPAREEVEEIAKTACLCARLTNQMLAYSGKGKFVVEDIDLRNLVEDMKDLLGSSVSKKAILTLDLADDLPAIAADASQVRQVVMNLVVNASEAIGDEPGRITVTASAGRCDMNCPCRDEIPGADEWPEGPRVTLEVSDTGCGMDEETCTKMFEPFFTTKFTGRGLGLAAVHGILRGHKAGIEVESEPGKGTTFKVHFPSLEQPATPAQVTKVSDKGWRGSGTVLLVDDEAIIRCVGGEALKRLGFTVVTANDGVDAIEMFKKHASEIVCVVLDLSMPRMDGEETFSELCQLRSDVPVFLSSGYSEVQASERFAGKGLAGFIEKPYKMNTLRTKLGRVLQG